MIIKPINSYLIKIILIISLIPLISNCGIYKPVDARKVSPNVDKRVEKNIQEGRGFKVLGGKKRGSGTFEFASSNEMWRASIDLLDFTPLSNVDYSGGIIITDWYYDAAGNSEESIKISIRFLSNDIKSENLKVTVHQRVCKNSVNCKIDLLENSNIKEELHRTILRKASLIEKDQKNKKQ